MQTEKGNTAPWWAPMPRPGKPWGQGGAQGGDEYGDGPKKPPCPDQKGQTRRRGTSRAEQDRETDRKNGITTCRGCVYYRSGCGVPGAYMMCHYAWETGLQRGIRPADCYKHKNTPYQPRRKKRGS